MMIRKDILWKDIKKMPAATLTFFGMGLALVLLRNSGFGLDPWGVFHDGLVIVTGISFGKTIEYFGYIILFFSLFIKIYPGFGTVMNIMLVGNFFDLIDRTHLLDAPDAMWLRILFFIVGFILLNFTRARYISFNLGAGPRDGLFVGVVRMTGIDVKYVKTGIEIVVFVLGVIMGGTVGIGTIILTLFAGYAVEFFFKVIGYDPKKRINHSFLTYFYTKE